MNRHPKMLAGLQVFFLLMGVCLGGFPLPGFAAQSEAPDALKIALLPIMDTLPFHVALERGLFDDAGLQVTPVPVSSGLERDQLMQAGEIDGMLNEMITTALFNQNGVRVRIVMTARIPQPGYPLFRILSAAQSGLRRVEDLAGIPVGVAKNTIIEYVTDRLLAAHGLRRDQIRKSYIPVIPERYQLLLQGRLKAATLPDPLAFSALQAGAVALADDTAHPTYSVSVLSFSVKTLKNKEPAVRSFLQAWNRAARMINAHPEAFRSLVLQRIRLPENIEKSFPIPPFPLGRVPLASQWSDVMEWMRTRGLLRTPLLYRESVTPDTFR